MSGEKKKKEWGGVLGKFGQYLKEHNVDREELAAALRCTPSYVSMFAHAKAQPGRDLAVGIELWTTLKYGEDNAFRCVDWPRERFAFERA